VENINQKWEAKYGDKSSYEYPFKICNDLFRVKSMIVLTAEISVKVSFKEVDILAREATPEGYVFIGVEKI
jgi:hypothetical protein